MAHDRLGDLASDGHRRVERRHRVLEDDRHLVAPDVADLPVGDLGEITAFEAYGPTGDKAARREKADYRHAGHGLATAGLADDADRLADVDCERDPVHGPDDGVALADVGPEVVYLKQRRHGPSLCR